MSLRIVFVLSPYQNAFFPELAEALRQALTARDVRSITCSEPDRHVVEDDDVFVLLPPHEYVTLEGSSFVDESTVAARTIGVSAEQPHQIYFRRNAEIASRLGAVLDFSDVAVEAYESLGIAASHLGFGYVPSWDLHQGRRRDASIVTEGPLYLGNKQPRRLEWLAEASDVLVARRAVLRVSDNSEPNRRTSPSFVTGDDKRALLRRSRLLINIHQSDEPYFEWLRFAEAAHCGLPVLTERSLSSAPFVPDEHFLTFGPGELACSIEAALADQERLDEVADAAYDVLRQRPLASTIEPLVRAADELLRNRPPERLPGRTRTEPLGRHRIAPEPRGSWPSRRVLLRQSLQRSPAATILAPPGTTFRQPLELRRRALFCTCMYDGVDTSGRPTLEGLWPWEPWRLTFGQHLGRVMLVDDRLLDATRRWISEPWAREHETLAVQLFAAVHGLAGDHVPRPLASVTGSPLDPTQSVPEPVASRCRQILGGV
jgi:hypothetical protein